MEKITDFILKNRLIILLVTVLLTIFFGLQIPKLKINSDFIKSLPIDDPIANQYKYIGDEFKGTDLSIIIVEAENILTQEKISLIAQLTDSLRVTEGITSVTSLTDIMHIETDSLGFEISKLIDEYNLPKSDEEIENIRQKIENSDRYKGVIISEDYSSTIIMYVLSNDIDQSLATENINNKIKNMNLPLKLYFGGMPVLVNDISKLILEDLFKLIPFIAIILILVLFLCFRSLRGVIFPLLSVSIASIWTLGIMSLLNYEITMISGNIPVVLFAVGSAYAIHVVNHINETKERDYYRALKQSLSYLIIPVFLSAITTVFGFISFIYGAYLIMIKEFGIFAALGTFISLIIALTLVPILQYYFPLKKFESKNEKSENSIIYSIILKPIHLSIIKFQKYILLFWISTFIIGIFFSFKIIRSSDVSSYFKVDNPTRISENILQSKFGGSSPIYILFKGDIQSPNLLKKMDDLENYLMKNEHISTTTSVAGIIKEMNNAMGEGMQIPMEKEKIEQLWFLIEGQEILQQLVNSDLTEAIVQSRFASTKTSEVDDFLKSLETWTSEMQTEDCEIIISGMPSVYNQIDKSLLKSQMSSLFIAVILVYLIITVILKSFKLGLYGTIPILTGICLLFGFMGLTKIPLDFATVLVAGVALGIGIDYSIHIINAYKFHSLKSSDINEIIEKTILINGKAIVINALTVSSGFLVLLFSQLLPIQYFGLLISISMIISSFSALTLLPVLLILKTKKQSKTL